ncbi:MAG: AraC family transcriptional regulator, partial [Oscillospiraceae bacterium]
IAFLELLLEVCSLLNQTDFMTVVPTRLRGRIEDVLEYIQKNLAAPLSLDLLAEQFFLSKYYLCRLFREETGFSVGDYIIRCRIQRACALLRGQMNVQQAGEAVGFQNNAHFIRTFGRITGVSPGRYHHQFSCPTES